jgi:hypothetical protein
MAKFSLTPAHGWRAFATEITVVFIGVLIALSAQQLVNEWQWRSEVTDFRAAIDDELGRNLDAYQLRIEQGACLRKRLDQLAVWVDRHERGQAGKLESVISRPRNYGLQFSVWRQAGDAVSRLPLDSRLRYAKMYDEFENYDYLRRSERDIWHDIRDYEGSGRLSPDQLFRLRGLITRARTVNESNESNWTGIQSDAAAIGIRRLSDPEEVVRTSELCEPLRWERA